MNIWTDVLSGLTAPIADYLKRRAELKVEQAKLDQEIKMKEHEQKLAVIDRQTELLKTGLAADANWEMEFARQAASSWKDEYTLFVVSIPMVLSFIPSCSAYVKAGFEALAATPTWYQILLVSIFFATYGIRYWRRTQSDT